MTPVPAARFWMPVIGQIVPELVTVPLPPPMVWVPAPPSTPITAIDEPLVVASGSTPLFLSRTVPSWAPWTATWVCACVVTVAAGDPLGALSNMP